MSLHTLANHMAAQGRNNDSMLVHMTPKEVSGLHALAAANGGQLTINPETGLPEAGLLEDLLPALIGFGLNTFVPGLGEVVGGASGLGAAAGTGIAAGGLTALATGNLSKGVMAGFGAYGGAGLGESLMGAGTGELASQKLAEQQAAGTFPTLAGQSPEQITAYANEVNAARSAAQAGLSPMDKLTAGFSATTKSPGALLDYAKGNLKYGLAAAAPALINGFSKEGETVTKMPDNRMITPFVMNRKNLPYDDSLSPSAQQRYLSYGVTPITPVRAAEGGAVQHFDAGGGVGGTDDYTQSLLDAAAPRAYRNTMTGDSKAAYDYLMGNRATAPGTPIKPKPPRLPGVGLPGAPALSTAGISALGPTRGGEREPSNYGSGAGLAQFGGSGFSGATTNQYGDSGPTTGVASMGNKLAAYLGNMGLTGISDALAKNVDTNYGHEGAVGMRKALGGGMGVAPAPAPETLTDFGTEKEPGWGTQLLRESVETNDKPPNIPPAPVAADAQQGLPGVTFATDSRDFSTQYGPDREGPGESAGNTLNRQLTEAAPPAPAPASEAGLGDPNAPSVASQFEKAQKENQDRLNSFIKIADEQQEATAGAEAANAKQQAADARQTEINRQNAAYEAAARMAATTSDLPSNDNYSNEGRNYQSHDYSTHDPSGEAHDSHDARGGFLNHGRFDQRYAHGGGINALAQGGLGSLGGYSDGGRLLRGPGDGVSDDIPATIGEKQPARLADGEFVIPARIVSEIGNGSTEAGARQLYAMMDRIQAGRKKTVGKNKVAANTRAAKHLPA